MRIRNWMAGVLAACLLAGCAAPALAAGESGGADLPAGATGPGTKVVLGEGGTGQVTLNGIVGTGDRSVRVTVQSSGGAPVAGARVAVQMQENYALTDAAGQVLVTNLVYGVNYDFYVSAEGHYPKTELYTYWRDDRETDELVIALEAVPENPAGAEAATVPENPAEAEASPAPEAGAAVPGDATGDGRLVVKAEPGGSRVQVPQALIEESAASGRDITVEYTGQDGERHEALLPAFGAHDAGLLGGAELWVEELGGTPYLHLIKDSEEDEDGTDILVPHNLAAAALENGLGLKLSFRKGGTEEYLYSAELPQALVDTAAGGQKFELGVRYAAGGAALLVKKGGAHPDAALPVPGGAFLFAAQKGMDLAIEIYDPAGEEELWYQWLFTAEDLEEAGLGEADEARRSYDLYITGTPQTEDPILESTAGRQSQYVIIAHDGPLPAPARLRVKNLAGFEEPVGFWYQDPASGRLELLCEGLEPDKAGFYDAGKLDHCSSYVLTTGKAALTGALAKNWPWWLLAAAVLGGCGAGFAWSRKNKHERQEAFEEQTAAEQEGEG